MLRKDEEGPTEGTEIGQEQGEFVRTQPLQACRP